MPDDVINMMGLTWVTNEEIYFREIRTECSSMGEKEPCGVRIESENDIMDTIEISNSRIQNLSSLINYAKKHSKKIIEIKKKCETNSVHACQELEQLLNPSIVIRYNGNVSIRKVRWGDFFSNL